MKNIKLLLVASISTLLFNCSKSDMPENILPENPAISTSIIVSRTRSVYTKAGKITYLNDNKFGNGTTFGVSNNSWVAINIGTGLTKVFVSWNSPEYNWSGDLANAGTCKSTFAHLEDYSIQTSSNSTNGADGTWTDATSVTANVVSSRGHSIDFTGKSWIRLNITKGGGTIDEIEVFNQSNGANDTWLFPGTSISANTYKATPPAKNFADLITTTNTTIHPAMVRAGIACISSNGFAQDVAKYLENAKGIKYWAIEMGTNDAWGGGNGGVTNFKKNMQTVITACKDAGVTPIIARLLASNPNATGTNAVKWQVHPDYLKAIDDLTTSNNLMSGPDLYAYFLAHPEELYDDGVHPNATGAASIQRLWAEKMLASVYKK